MSSFARTLFGGSRFIRITLIPIVAYTAILLPLSQPGWEPRKVLPFALLEVALVLLLIGLIAPRGGRWAARTLGAMVFLAYVVYFAWELVRRPDSLFQLAPRGDASARNALLGLIFIGVPGLLFALRSDCEEESAP